MSCNGCGSGFTRYMNPFANTQLQGHPHTVRAPRTPLYQLGWMGQDDSEPDFSDLGPPVDSPILGPVDISSTFPLSPDQTPSYQDMLNNPNLIPTTPTTGTGVPAGPVASGAAPSVTSSITSALTSLFAPKPASTLAPGPSPRVTTAAPATMSLSSVLPVLAIGGLAIVLFTGGGRRRR